jgi:hypothetical protein
MIESPKRVSSLQSLEGGDGANRRRDRRALSADEISDHQLSAVRGTTVPARFADLDAELADWKP